MSNQHKTAADAGEFIAAVANRHGWQINPDTEFVDQLAGGLATNYNRYGYYLCPCRDGDGARELDRDIICPCEYNVTDQIEYGHCFCGLYLSREYAASENAPASIPERRPEGI